MGHKELDAIEQLLNTHTYIYIKYHTCVVVIYIWLPGGSDSKEFACNAGDPDSIPGLGKSPGKRNGYPLQYSCLENPLDREDWWATVHGVIKNQT